MKVCSLSQLIHTARNFLEVTKLSRHSKNNILVKRGVRYSIPLGKTCFFFYFFYKKNLNLIRKTVKFCHSLHLKQSNLYSKVSLPGTIMFIPREDKLRKCTCKQDLLVFARVTVNTGEHWRTEEGMYWRKTGTMALFVRLTFKERRGGHVRIG